MSLWCSHRNQTTPRRDERGEYCRCLECGGRIPWSWPNDFLIRPPRPAQPRQPLSLISKTTAVWETTKRVA